MRIHIETEGMVVCHTSAPGDLEIDGCGIHFSYLGKYDLSDTRWHGRLDVLVEPLDLPLLELDD